MQFSHFTVLGPDATEEEMLKQELRETQVAFWRLEAERNAIFRLLALWAGLVIIGAVIFFTADTFGLVELLGSAYFTVVGVVVGIAAAITVADLVQQYVLSRERLTDLKRLHYLRLELRQKEADSRVRD